MMRYQRVVVATVAAGVGVAAYRRRLLMSED
jgi:hypothetical protein